MLTASVSSPRGSPSSMLPVTCTELPLFISRCRKLDADRSIAQTLQANFRARYGLDGLNEALKEAAWAVEGKRRLHCM